MRTIDADLFKSNVKAWAENIRDFRSDNKCFFTEENVLKAIDDQPTIEDIQIAINKQIPQKIFHQGYEYEGQMIYPVGIDGVPYDLCPNCKTNLCTDGVLGRDKNRMKYCENCGQRLDWSE